ncbi:hypothetical protein ACRALDRAFT_205190 [Sodiomyces alcalophilus JCM 7366]|uniref:uncharacterized protein n=1 Tax=Sodiomyces alcalophilus JCM 7366 TaxID=591952 RepID=UPI0039B444A3
MNWVSKIFPVVRNFSHSMIFGAEGLSICRHRVHRGCMQLSALRPIDAEAHGTDILKRGHLPVDTARGWLVVAFSDQRDQVMSRLAYSTSLEQWTARGRVSLHSGFPNLASLPR